MTIPEMRYKIEQRVEELTKEEMVIVKKEAIKVDPNPAAVKAVLTNIGKKEERRSFKEGLGVGGDLKIENVIFYIKKNYDNSDSDISDVNGGAESTVE